MHNSVLFSAKTYSLANQSINPIIILVAVFIVKLLKEEGQKSQAFQILCSIIVVLIPIALIANMTQKSIDTTAKFSFKGAGTLYRRRFEKIEKTTVPSLTNKVLLNSDEKHFSNQKSPNKTLLYQRINGNLIESQKNQDFRVISSFDCNGSIPSAITSYVSNTFVTEYKRSYGDSISDIASSHLLLDNTTLSLTSHSRIVPNLTKVEINCGLGQPCNSLFVYDKQRGLSSNSDMTYQRPNSFYCCPLVKYFTDDTVANECYGAKTTIERSTFRESKKPFLLERVNKCRKYFFFLKQCICQTKLT